MVKRFLVVIALWSLCSFSLEGALPHGTTQVGFRLGLLSNGQNDLQVVTTEVRLYGNKTNFYIEGFLNYYLLPPLALVLNLGSYSKGDIRFDVYYNGEFDGSFLGSASIYPIQLGLKLTPFQDQLPARIRPYVEGGGAIIVGRETATFGTYGSVFERYSDGTVGSETDFSWWFGGGLEIPISRALQLDFMVKFIDTKFSGDIAGIKDYSGTQVSAGLGYLHFRKK